MINFLNKNKNKGAIITLVLVFGAIFILLLAGLLTFILLQHRVSLKKAAWNDSLHIAEAGINYYRWHLNQYIEADNSDIQDGHNVPGDDWCCKVGGVEYGQDDIQCKVGDFIICGRCDGEPCYEHDHYNPQGELIGKFVLEIKAKKICGQILGVYVNSIGSTIKYPNLERKVEAKFASTSIAEYGSIINEAVWRGTGENTSGKFHTNLGVKMDAVNNSLITSSVNNWLCTSSFGCHAGSCPAGCHSEGGNCRCDGVCGSGSPQDLWKFTNLSYTVPSFNFTEISNDLGGIKALAQSNSYYYPPSADLHANGKGYHVTFNGDGTFNIKIITNLTGVPDTLDLKRYLLGQNPYVITSYEKIATEESLPAPYVSENIPLIPECGLIYVEDDLWIEGTVKGKVTVAASDLRGPADTPPPLKEPSIYIIADLDYTAFDGSDSLAMIAEDSILITLDCDMSSANPDEIVLRGVFVAQNGLFGRNGYLDSHPYNKRVRNRLITYGTIVSFIRGEVTYVWPIWSGFINWDCYFDEKLSRDPPPLLPYVSEELKLISWEEIQ